MTPSLPISLTLTPLDIALLRDAVAGGVITEEAACALAAEWFTASDLEALRRGSEGQ